MVSTKIKLRHTQCNTFTEKYPKHLKGIMNANGTDGRLFYKLIRKQRSTGTNNTSNCLIINGTTHTAIINN